MAARRRPGPKRRFGRAFENFLEELRRRFRRHGIDVPRGGSIEWGLDDDTLLLDLPVGNLERNMQSNEAAGASFALALAYWSEQLALGPVRCRIRVTGEPSRASGCGLHRRRGLFVLSELAALLPRRFALDFGPTAPGWSWPQNPVLNAAIAPRDREGTKREHRLEMQLARGGSLLDAFNAATGAGVERFSRQLPVGLFEGEVAEHCEWTPRGASQIDLWGTSDGGTTLHLFELKAEKNARVGIIPEAFYYARLLSYVRGDSQGGGPIIQGGGDGITAARRATRIVMWLVGPEFHPLVLTSSRSPLAYLNGALTSSAVEFRILPFRADEKGIVEWLPTERWPA